MTDEMVTETLVHAGLSHATGCALQIETHENHGDECESIKGLIFAPPTLVRNYTH